MENWTDELLCLYLHYLGKRLNPSNESPQDDTGMVSDDALLNMMGIKIQKADK